LSIGLIEFKLDVIKNDFTDDNLVLHFQFMYGTYKTRKETYYKVHVHYEFLF